MIETFDNKILLESRMKIVSNPQYKHEIYKQIHPNLLLRKHINPMRYHNNKYGCIENSEYPTYFIMDSFLQHGGIPKITPEVYDDLYGRWDELDKEDRLDYVDQVVRSIGEKNWTYFRQIISLSERFGDHYESMLVYNIISKQIEENSKMK